ncbi:CCA tRNA nucleotidyltransferase [Aquibacillus koreensis]|uniref:CCA-adding enzyme n=1 Tax=Aquibacillus koreensis TaxID=279446 RepID=A0A9X4AGL6_9BACI|nr:CCA tRNA nucleotidyltransferase [Aquibacillus koreensis]MCT2537363.1 CCA tRNA nucleotidyltransferase [Aquibacillus koreensis]MDC3418809.1 CCA tRNA nucleotidyltransferase [Aquibacillus koreensis]
MQDPFVHAKQILKTLEQNGHKAYIVGGAVRDQFLDREIGDIDITTSAIPNEVQSLFEKVIPVGIEHGTVVVRYKNESYEVTTFRVEGNYTDFRHPDHVTFVDRIEDDLARRDFTINAMAMDINNHIIDPFDGQVDINSKVIRTVGNPDDRFQEDPLRMLRALRFSSQLGFSIETTTQASLMKNIHWVEQLATERVGIEIQKLFAGDFFQSVVSVLFLTKVSRYLPVLKENDHLFDVIKHIKEPLLDISEIIAVFHIAKPEIPIETWVSQWKLSNKTKGDIKNLVGASQQYRESKLTNWLVYTLPEHLIDGFVRIIDVHMAVKLDSSKIMIVKQSLPIQKRQDLAINGQELVQLFPDRKKGPWINQYFFQLEKDVVDGKVQNQKIELSEWIMKWNRPGSI